MPITFRPAPSVERIAGKLIPDHHQHLSGVRIEYVFRSKASKTNGKTVMGRARKISGLNAYLADGTHGEDGVDGGDADFFVVEIAEDVWVLLDDKQRVALVDHELCHCTIDIDDDGTAKIGMAPHDLEEFRAIVERHGLWQPDLTEFAAAVQQAQLSFDEDGDE